MPTERQLTVIEACAEIATLDIERRIDRIFIHHCFNPSASDYHGIQTVTGVGRTHARWWPKRSDHGYHVMIGPGGEVFFCCDWDKVGAHAKYHNARSIGVSYIADFGGGSGERPPRDNPATYAGLEAGQRVVAALCERLELEPEDVWFHRQVNSHKTCPGELMDLDDYRAKVAAIMNGGIKLVLLTGSSDPDILIARSDQRVALEKLFVDDDQILVEVYDHIEDQNKVYFRKVNAE